MKKLFLLVFISVASTIAAQTPLNCGQRIDPRSSCNRSWSYNNERFYRLVWEGITSGKIKAYTGYDELKPVSVSDLYAETIGAITHSYELEGIYDEPIRFSTRADSMRLLSPNFIEIFGKYDAEKKSLRITKEWVKFVCVFEPEFSYQLSYPDLIRYLDQTNSYWVNPYFVSDSVSFSKALEEERYVFDWLGLSDEEAYSSSNYANNILQTNAYVFNGYLTRYASVIDTPNHSYGITRPKGNLISVVMQAYLLGKLKGYNMLNEGAYEVPAATFNKNMVEALGNPDWLYFEEGQRELVLDDYASMLDLFGVRSSVELHDTLKLFTLLNKDEPQYFFIGMGAQNPNNYRGFDLPYIFFDYNEAMKVLETSGLTWYALDNNADSCSFGAAIKANKVYWKSAYLSDQQNGFIYGMSYDRDSAKVVLSDGAADACVLQVVNYTCKIIERKMNVRYADKNYPSKPNIPLYLKYTGYRYLDPAEDSTLLFLRQFVPYLIRKAQEGKITLYSNDSLNTKISTAEFNARMSINGIEYDEQGNEREIVALLAPDEFNLCRVTTEIQVNAKEKVLIKDKALTLYMSPESNPIGIAIPIGCVSYADLMALLKMEKAGKAYLKQLDATAKEKRYQGLLNIYGEYLYDYWNDVSQFKEIHSTVLPYMKVR